MVHGAWSVAVLLPEAVNRDDMMAQLERAGIETRPMFPPMHTMPIYEGNKRGYYFVSEHLATRGIMLPTHADLGDETVLSICGAVSERLNGHACGE